MIWTLNLVVQLLGLAGFALLAVPAFHAARYARALVDAHKAKPEPGMPGEAAHTAAVTELQRLRDDWTPAKGFCLVAGTLLSAASYAVALFVAIATPVPPVL